MISPMTKGARKTVWLLSLMGLTGSGTTSTVTLRFFGIVMLCVNLNKSIMNVNNPCFKSKYISIKNTHAYHWTALNEVYTLLKDISSIIRNCLSRQCLFLPNMPSDSEHWGSLNPESETQDSKGTCIICVLKLTLCVGLVSICNMPTLPAGNESYTDSFPHSSRSITVLWVCYRL